MNFADQLEDKIRDCRSEGYGICRIFHGREVVPLKKGLKQLGMLSTSLSFCIEVDKQKALEILVTALRYHLSSDTYEVMLENDSKEIAKQFIEAIPGMPKLYVNEIWGGYEPLTNHHYDRGIMAIDKGIVAILWVMDDV
jgi:regulator of replication initiation timing